MTKMITPATKSFSFSKIAAAAATTTKTTSISTNQIQSGGDFFKLASESQIFVDKSMFIKFMIESKSEVVLITMPRRWGKSVNIDMLRRFLAM